jgi:hypothetical protein
MKYLCLVYLSEKAPHTVHDRECWQFATSVFESGVCVAAEALQPTDTATTVRVRNGRTTVTDGPFAETVEQLAGFYRSGSCRLSEGDAARVQRVPPVQPVQPVEQVERVRGSIGSLNGPAGWSPGPGA